MPTLSCYCLSLHAFSNTACDTICGGSKSVGDVLAFEECVQSDRSLQRRWAVLRVKLNVVPNSSAVGRPLGKLKDLLVGKPILVSAGIWGVM